MFEYDSFIDGDYISKDLCDELVDYFNYNKKYVIQGHFGGGQVDNSVKESFDLGIGANNLDTIIGEYRKALQVCLEKYLKKYEYANDCNFFTVRETYIIQKYPIGGGFKRWHFENTGNGESVSRHLVFMTYLNDVEDGGTEFLFQKVKTKAEKGLTLIWPAAWTHTHRGIVSTTKEKMIITGWFNFIQ